MRAQPSQAKIISIVISRTISHHQSNNVESPIEEMYGACYRNTNDKIKKCSEKYK